MIAVDTNVLVYAHREDATFHAPAAAALRTLAEGRSGWAIPWPCLHEFIAVVTNARIYDPPSTLDQALAQVQAWLESPALRLLSEGPDHFAELGRLASAAAVTGARIHDARVAALCTTHGVRELWSLDRDFSRFPDCAVRNPLAG